MGSTITPITTRTTALPTEPSHEPVGPEEAKQEPPAQTPGKRGKTDDFDDAATDRTTETEVPEQQDFLDITASRGALDVVMNLTHTDLPRKSLLDRDGLANVTVPLHRTERNHGADELAARASASGRELETQ